MGSAQTLEEIAWTFLVKYGRSELEQVFRERVVRNRGDAVLPDTLEPGHILVYVNHTSLRRCLVKKSEYGATGFLDCFLDAMN